jgi:hypothetical protein
MNDTSVWGYGTWYSNIPNSGVWGSDPRSLYQELSRAQPLDLDSDEIEFRYVEQPMPCVPVQDWHFDLMKDDAACMNMDFCAFPGLDSEAMRIMSVYDMPRNEVGIIGDAVFSVEKLPDGVSTAETNERGFLVDHLSVVQSHLIAMELLREVEALDADRDVAEGNQKQVGTDDIHANTILSYNMKEACEYPDVTIVPIDKRLEYGTDKQMKNVSSDEIMLSVFPYTKRDDIRPGGDYLGSCYIGAVIHPDLHSVPIEDLSIVDLMAYLVRASSNYFHRHSGYVTASNCKLHSQERIGMYLSTLMHHAVVGDSEDYEWLRFDHSTSPTGVMWPSVEEDNVVRKFLSGSVYPGLPYDLRGRSVNISDFALGFVSFWGSCGTYLYTMIFDLAQYIVSRKYHRQFNCVYGDIIDRARDFFVSFGWTKRLGVFSHKATECGDHYLKYCHLSEVFKELGDDSKYIRDYEQSSDPMYVIVEIDRQVKSPMPLDFPVMFGNFMYVATIGYRYNKGLHFMCCVRRMAFLHRSVLVFGSSSVSGPNYECHYIVRAARNGNFEKEIADD